MTENMTSKELAEYLKLHKITIYKLAAKGEIPGIKIGSVWRFNKRIIDQWISGSQRKPSVKEKPKTKTKSPVKEEPKVQTNSPAKRTHILRKKKRKKNLR